MCFWTAFFQSCSHCATPSSELYQTKQKHHMSHFHNSFPFLWNVCLLSFLPGNLLRLNLFFKDPRYLCTCCFIQLALPKNIAVSHIRLLSGKAWYFLHWDNFTRHRDQEPPAHEKATFLPLQHNLLAEQSRTQCQHSETYSKPEQANKTDAICHSLESIFPASLDSRQPESIQLKGSKGVFYHVMLYQCFLCREKHNKTKTNSADRINIYLFSYF